MGKSTEKWKYKKKQKYDTFSLLCTKNDEKSILFSSYIWIIPVSYLLAQILP